MMTEKVLSIDKSMFDKINFDGFSFVDKSYIIEVINSNMKFIERDIVEDDFTLWQIIPYVIIKSNNKIFLTKRTKKQSEQRLHNLSSIGIGGHINDTDATEHNIIISSLQREIHEELYLCQPSLPIFIGVINDLSTEVSKAHLGMVFLVEVDEYNASVKEKEKMTGQWVDINQIYNHYYNMETWSKIILDANKKEDFLCRTPFVNEAYLGYSEQPKDEVIVDSQNLEIIQKTICSKLNQKDYLFALNPKGECAFALVQSSNNGFVAFECSNNINGYSLIDETHLYQLIRSNDIKLYEEKIIDTGILTAKYIRKLILCENLFENFKLSNIRSTGYDIRLGEFCYVVGSHNSEDIQSIVKLELNDELDACCSNNQVEIPPHGLLIFQTEEKIKVPPNILGKLLLRMSYVKKGLILPSQSHAQPGYFNYLFGCLYNLSDKAVILKRGDSVAMLEISKISEVPENQLYNNGIENYTIHDFAQENISSGFAVYFKKLNETSTRQKENFDKMMSLYKSESEKLAENNERNKEQIENNEKNYNKLLSFISCLAIIVTILMAIAAGSFFNTDKVIKNNKYREQLETQSIEIESLNNTIKEMQTKLDELQTSVTQNTVDAESGNKN